MLTLSIADQTETRKHYCDRSQTTHQLSSGQPVKGAAQFCQHILQRLSTIRSNGVEVVAFLLSASPSPKPRCDEVLLAIVRQMCNRDGNEMSEFNLEDAPMCNTWGEVVSQRQPPDGISTSAVRAADI